ncbi:hypothetical protein M878_44530 [Streptomyces roseochromogenus subsp. oscitans DS 12.976]|uniref:Uncharacterized protein n=1 Tax=Streptomyces roseochromogenus subsp. oscitans DS 12.976 TaxID=1352936 RepID=V6JPF4_STRRC|nr:hypothetical protein M878_44530 [Streptomyces roseochromogenus subsp. oscitans DS 12.976]
MVAVSTVPWHKSRQRPISVLDLPCAERTVGVEAALKLPNVMMLVVEDTCAQIAHEDWQHREPTCWHPQAHRCWRSEGRLLRAKKARLKELAAQCLDAPD